MNKPFRVFLMTQGRSGELHPVCITCANFEDGVATYHEYEATDNLIWVELVEVTPYDGVIRRLFHRKVINPA